MLKCLKIFLSVDKVFFLKFFILEGMVKEFSLSTHFGITACAIHFLIDRVGENSFTIPAEIKNLRKKLYPQIKKFLDT